MDLFFSGKYCYLLAIDVKSRYLFCVNTNIKEIESKNSKIKVKNEIALILAMRYLIEYKKWKPLLIKTDDEKGFNSELTKELVYKKYNIKHCNVPRYKMENGKTVPIHTALSLIDRVSRTIRDMYYNLDLKGDIKPKIMYKLVYYYNNSPHRTLSKYFGLKITPNEVFNNLEIQDLIAHKVQIENTKILNIPGFKIPINSIVQIDNETLPGVKKRNFVQKDLYKVLGFNNTMYQLENINTKEKRLLPRYRIK